MPSTKDDTIWLRRTHHFCNFAVAHWDVLWLEPDEPYSLYEGMAGLAALLIDLQHADEARFPLFEFDPLVVGAIAACKEN